MTEKRFIVADCSTCVFDKITKEEYVCIDKEEASLVCDRFNKFVDKNEKLKTRVKYLERKIGRERKSNIIEHEKWEKEVIELIREQRKMIDDFNKENEQLKQQLDYIQNSISEHIKHQKTELGQKALKEVIQDYNKWLLEPNGDD